ncbi:ABC transporter substrate-binding protein [Roseomonas sp. AR75]|uniref:ABC transporter substrate-binding protein n=1 Tax=Roseomonas sp. AR75 TaxID=2562311 RepID=UPI0010C10EA2|nr:ABC transporter substrate-binding protein [Roseomonas sp. AR75]
MAIGRRTLLKASAAAPAGAMVGVEASAQGRTVVNLQLGWLLSGNQIGEVCAKQLGYYEQEGLELRFQAGGPSIDGVAIVASGRFEVGQVSSSPSLMLASSQGIPIRCFAAGAQEHPFSYISRASKPVREPRDLIGKKVGTQSTAVILLRAMLAKHNIAENQVQVIPMGADMSPLLTGQVDVVTGWLTNTTAMRVIPDPVVMRLWDTGVRLYALPYYATQQTIERRADVLAKFLRASGRGWAFANQNRDQAAEMLVKEFTNLKLADEREALDVMLQYAFSPKTAAEGWGTMDPKVWQDQIDLYAQLGQFRGAAPKLDDVMTMNILRMTADARPKIG